MTGRIHVLFVIPTLHGGGAERVVTTILRHMDRRRFRLSLAVVNTRGAVFVPPDWVELHDLKCSRVRYAAGRIIRLIWKLRPDCVLSTLDRLNIAACMAKPFLPRDCALAVRPTVVAQAQSWLYRTLMRRFLGQADRIVAQSPEMAESLITILGLYPSRTTILLNPVVFPTNNVQPIRRLATNGAFNLVAAGRLDPQKGFDLLIRAFAKARRPDLKLFILGDGTERPRLERMIEEFAVGDSVELTGWCDRPYDYYAQADGFVLSSRFEGFPNVLIEALSCGTPVIAFPVPGVKSLLERAPGCEFVESFEEDALAQAITRFTARGRQRVDSSIVQQFEASTAVRAYEQMFAELKEQSAWTHRARPLVEIDAG